jgi:hypothetical protein
MKLTFKRFSGIAGVAAGAVLSVLGLGMPSTASADPDFVVDLPAGQACPSFDLRVEITGNPNRVYREFHDKSGNLVRVLGAGKGNTLTFINLGTGATLSPRPNGSVEHTTFDANGMQTTTITGHNVLILFPSDVPAGPSTKMYVGRVVFTVDTSSVFTVQSVSGKSMDICAALSG